jgi:hypothetical protein
VAGSGDEDAFVGQGWHPLGIVCLVTGSCGGEIVTRGGAWVGFAEMLGC